MKMSPFSIYHIIILVIIIFVVIAGYRMVRRAPARLLLLVAIGAIIFAVVAQRLRQQSTVQSPSSSLPHTANSASSAPADINRQDHVDVVDAQPATGGRPNPLKFVAHVKIKVQFQSREKAEIVYGWALYPNSPRKCESIEVSYIDAFTISATPDAYTQGATIEFGKSPGQARYISPIVYIVRHGQKTTALARSPAACWFTE
jgi:hypothetical protein